jgi:hypothetical protein
MGNGGCYELERNMLELQNNLMNISILSFNLKLVQCLQWKKSHFSQIETDFLEICGLMTITILL